jgi:hypothetical protein
MASQFYGSTGVDCTSGIGRFEAICSHVEKGRDQTGRFPFMVFLLGCPGYRCKSERRKAQMPRLAGKVAFITGAATGIGRATAILFAREGAKVAIADIDGAAGEETARLAGNEAIAMLADVTDPDSLQAAIRTTIDKFGRLDVLHNNAGGSTAQDDTESMPRSKNSGARSSSIFSARFSVAALGFRS